MVTELEKKLAETLASVIDSGLLNGLTVLHDRVRAEVYEALADFEEQRDLEKNRITY